MTTESNLATDENKRRARTALGFLSNFQTPSNVPNDFVIRHFKPDQIAALVAMGAMSDKAESQTLEQGGSVMLRSFDVALLEKFAGHSLEDIRKAYKDGTAIQPVGRGVA